jgi:hypothetical protein
MWEHTVPPLQKPSWKTEQHLPDTKPAGWHLDIRLLSCQNYKKQIFMIYKLLVYGILLEQHKVDTLVCHDC